MSANIRIVVDANTAVNDSDYTIIMRKLSGDHTIALPDAATSKGRVLVINQANSAEITSGNYNPVYVKFTNAGGAPVEVIYGDTENPSTPGSWMDVKYDYIAGSIFGGATGGTMKITLQSDGTNWYVISFTL